MTPQPTVSTIAFSWLSSKVSLSKKLREFTSNKIAHHLFYDDWGDAPDFAYTALNIKRDSKTWIRNMQWRMGDAVWLDCTVVIPASSIVEETMALQHIGKNSIGDILFQDPTLTRSDFTFIKENHDRWSRYSIFYFHGKPLLIHETFLPDFFHAIHT
jgi:chorismate--pyruvate lyase